MLKCELKKIKISSKSSNKNGVKSNKILLLHAGEVQGKILNVIKYYSTGTGSGTPGKNF